MGKRKVLSAFAALLLLAGALAILTFHTGGSITGRAISLEEDGELFIGERLEFEFDIDDLSAQDGKVNARGEIYEIKGTDQQISIESYALNEDGEIAGEYKGSAYVGHGDNVKVVFSYPYSGAARISEVMFYLGNGDTMIRESRSPGSSLLVGNTISAISGDTGGRIFAWLATTLAFGALFLAMLKSYSRHRREVRFASTLGQKHHRKFIDLDIR